MSLLPLSFLNVPANVNAGQKSNRKESFRLPEMNESSYQNHFVVSKKPVLIVFSALWCEPCRELESKFEPLARRFGKRIEMFKVDMPPDRKSESLESYFFETYGVNTLPTAILFKGGSVFGRIEEKIDEATGPFLQRIRLLIEGGLRVQ